MSSSRSPDEALLEIALAVADGNELPWDALRDELGADDAAAVAALREVSRLTQLKPKAIDTAFAPARWNHLSVLGPVGVGDPPRFSARDEVLGREVLLTLTGPLDGDVARTETLLRTCRQRAAIAHPSLARVYGADYAQDRVGFWSERLAGRSLSDAIADGTTFAVNEACELGTRVCGALSALHEAGLVIPGIRAHDVIEVPARGWVLEAAFCEAASKAASGPQRDVFEVGALLVFVLSGTSLHEPVDPAVVIDRLQAARPDVPRRMLSVIERCLSPELNQRYRTPADVERALADAIAESTITTEWMIGFTVTVLVILALLLYGVFAT